MRYLKKEFNYFINSFKDVNKNYLSIMGLDLGFFTFLLVVLNIFSSFAMSILDKFQENVLFGLEPGDMASRTSEDFQMFNQLYQGLAIKLFIFIILVLLLIFLVYALTRYISWNIILKKKFYLKVYKGFALLNLLWLLILGAVLFFPGYFIVNNAYNMMLIVLLVLFSLVSVLVIHLTILLHRNYLLHRNIKKSFNKSFSTGFRKIHHFILPYLLSVLVFIVLNGVSYLFMYIGAENIVTLLITTGFLLFFMAWIRFYMSSTIDRIEKI